MEKQPTGGGVTVGPGSTSSVPKIMVFRPTLEEMGDFSRYLEYMESQGAHRAGLAKVIPPREWVPRKGGYEDIAMTIPSPICQEVSGGQGLYEQYNIQRKPMTVKEFKRIALSDKYKAPVHFDYEDLERKYWKNIAYNPPIYGADVSGSLYDPGVKEFNINQLNTILDLVNRDYGIKIEGVNTAYLYFGMWKTTFAWHTEDMDLYSINYLHFGAPKSWYCVPPEHGRRLERLAAGFFHSTAQKCAAFLRHKMTVISPQILRQYSIPYNKITQEAGEFMITFPYGYHAGFNHGFNCAESTNFALPRWVEYGKRASQCLCRQDCVKISMDVFVKRFQPERYELWLAGQDVGCHPEDPTSRVAARPPTHIEMAMLRSMIKSKSKRHPVLAKGCLVPEEDGDTDGTEIYDPDDDDDRGGPRKQRRPSKGSKRKGAPPARGAKRGPRAKAPPRPPPSAAQYSGLVQELRVVVEPLVAGPPKLEPLQASPAVAPPLLPPGDAEEARPLPALSPTPGAVGGDRWSLMTPAEAPPSTAAPSQQHRLVPPSERPPEAEEEVTRTPGMPHQLCLGLAIRRQPLHPAAPGGEDSSSSAEDEEPGWSSAGGDPPPASGGGASPPAPPPGGASWASAYVDLWSFRPASLYAERQLNLHASTLEPHCALCVLFRPLQYARQESPRQPAQLPASSAVWMPALCFVNGGLDVKRSAEGGLPDIPDAEVAASELLVCTGCSVCVHAHCYGVALPVDKASWKCDRCSVQATSVECCLCSLRGGALKATTHGRWVHLLCALLVPEVTLVDTRTRSPVDVRGVTPQRARLRCTYCHKLRDRLGSLRDSGACIQCTLGKCTTAFHVTCAHAAGVAFLTADWPLPVFVKCTKHLNPPVAAGSRPDAGPGQRPPPPPVAVGSRVVAKHKNGRYYWGQVVESRSQDFYAVDFEDNSSCDNLRPSDVVSRDCERLGPPQPGDVISVTWTDRKVYSAVFKALRTTTLYTVVFEDESERTAKREDVYAEGEELPKRVKSSLRRRPCSTWACSKSSRWKVVAGGSSTCATSTTTSCSCEPPLRCPPLFLRREPRCGPRQ
ncbi:lysine-specific demethylase 4A-like isoform X2 [Haemaphysalis longicornis]